MIKRRQILYTLKTFIYFEKILSHFLRKTFYTLDKIKFKHNIQVLCDKIFFGPFLQGFFGENNLIKITNVTAKKIPFGLFNLISFSGNIIMLDMTRGKFLWVACICEHIWNFRREGIWWNVNNSVTWGMQCVIKCTFAKNYAKFKFFGDQLNVKIILEIKLCSYELS